MTVVPGPIIVLRPASPNVPGSGAVNADVLKNTVVVGLLTRDRRTIVVRAQRAVHAACDVADVRRARGP